MIRFNGVHKWFKDLHVLNDVNLHVSPGEVVVVCGPSGSGKSTLIRTINQLEPINKGQLVVDGMDLSDPKTDINKLRAEVGFVFQQFNLYPHLSVMGNITLAPIKIRKMAKKEAEQQAMSLLERVGLAHKHDAYPSQLSGGQQQRVALARAIAIRPRFLLLDEPTSALDPEMTAEVLDLIGELRAEGRDLIMATHHMGFARSAADQCIFVCEGGIAEAGPAAELFANPRSEKLRNFLEKVLKY